MRTSMVPKPDVCSPSSQRRIDPHAHFFYETCCGLCGAQIHFRDPLTDWTKVYCPGCGEYVAVR
jgi:predicted RNA-binding Zn-ribbon protein involved in translation (DUF1610 family)